MNNKVKNGIIFLVFLVLLFASNFLNLFSKNVLWPEKYNFSTPFHGLVFKDPSDISGLTVERSIEKEKSGNLIVYKINFEYDSTGSSFRILGSPVRQVYFPDGIIPVKSNATLKGDYSKINDALFTDELKYRDLYKNATEYEFLPESSIMVPLTPERTEYEFTLVYAPKELVYGRGMALADTSVFITNARTEKVNNITGKEIKAGYKTFNQSGFYVTPLEITLNNQISTLSILNNIATIVFIASAIVLVLMIWIDRYKLEYVYVILMYLMILTFHRFLGYGIKTLGLIIVLPIIAYISSLLAKLMTRERFKVTTKDFRQSIAYTLAFLLVVVVVYIIPRAF